MQLAPSALHDIAGALGGHFGWTLNELIIDGIVRLDGPHERGIAMRLNSDGSNIQLWAIGGVQHNDEEPAGGIAPLLRGHHWNSWVHIGRLEADGDPATILNSAITEHLMPVFDTKPLYVGHRPWEEVLDSALSEVMAESTPPKGTSLRDCAPEAHTEPHDVGWEGAADAEPAPAPEPAAEPAEETAPEPTEQPAAQAVAEPQAESVVQPAPEPAAKPAEEPAAEPESPAESPAKVPPIRSRRKSAAKVDNPAATSDKPARPARKRTPAKKAADKPAS
ncbi:hypothetical protein [Streptomyces sp. NPDC091217]|uniref:hypothetical protein n=1 Tax=Streptomyces sp. NPDC091217 TaxID=3365975 RepID=UPI0038174D35